MPAVNASVKRFENGGILTLTASATAYTVSNIQPGTVKITEGQRKRLEYTDRGTQQTPLAGDEALCQVEVELKLGKLQGTGEVLALARATGTNGAVMVYTSAEIKIPDAPSSSTGEKVTLSNFWFDGVPKVESGADFDRITGIVMKCKLADYVVASY